jgi:hypothetical protein
MADKPKPAVKTPEAPGQRSAKADPDRKDTAGSPKTPKTSGAPVRDVREDPASHPNGDPRGKGTPRPPDNRVTGAWSWIAGRVDAIAEQSVMRS